MVTISVQGVNLKVKKRIASSSQHVNVVVQLDQTNIMIIENVLLFLVKKQINWVQNLIKQGNLFANSFPSDLGLWSCYNGVINRLHKYYNIFYILRISAVILGVS